MTTTTIPSRRRPRPRGTGWVWAIGSTLWLAACNEPPPQLQRWLHLAIPALSAAAPRIDAELERAKLPPPLLDEPTTDIIAQRKQMFENMRRQLMLTPDQLAKVEKIVSASNFMGQGFIKPTHHPLTRAQCVERRRAAGLLDKREPGRCAAPYMSPLYDPGAGQKAEDAKVCIDQFEFPNVPCDYPVTWVSALEASQLCKAVGKRLCDAHEWEGACAGALKPAESEYDWGNTRATMALYHNQKREVVWAYGPKKDQSLCGTGSSKSKDCFASGYECGTNTYPTGSFPACVSKFGVYDQHGNAAEHMNYAMQPNQLASRGSLGVTEMKGSWFIFGDFEAHEDDCRWRAPDWHGSKIMDPDSHYNYHLGFRCCKDVK